MFIKVNKISCLKKRLAIYASKYCKNVEHQLKIRMFGLSLNYHPQNEKAFFNAYFCWLMRAVSSSVITESSPSI